MYIPAILGMRIYAVYANYIYVLSSLSVEYVNDREIITYW